MILDRFLRQRRDKIYRANLADAKAALDGSGLTFFLNCGTLLSAVRDRGPVPGDLRDIDLSIFNRELTLPRRKAATEAFERLGFVCRPDGRVDPRQLRFDRDGNHIDVFCYSRHEDWYLRYWTTFGDVPMIVPAHHLDRLDTVSYCDQIFFIPSDTDDFLTLGMGRDWREPKTGRTYRRLNAQRLREHRARYGDFCAGRFDARAYLERGFGWER